MSELSSALVGGHIKNIALAACIAAVAALSGCSSLESQPTDKVTIAKQYVDRFATAIGKNDLAQLDAQMCPSMIRSTVQATLQDLGPDGRESLKTLLLNASYAPTMSTSADTVFLIGTPPSGLSSTQRIVLRASGTTNQCIELLPSLQDFGDDIGTPVQQQYAGQPTKTVALDPPLTVADVTAHVPEGAVLIALDVVPVAGQTLSLRLAPASRDPAIIVEQYVKALKPHVAEVKRLLSSGNTDDPEEAAATAKAISELDALLALPTTPESLLVSQVRLRGEPAAMDAFSDSLFKPPAAENQDGGQLASAQDSGQTADAGGVPKYTFQLPPEWRLGLPDDPDYFDGTGSLGNSYTTIDLHPGAFWGEATAQEAAKNALDSATSARSSLCNVPLRYVERTFEGLRMYGFVDEGDGPCNPAFGPSRAEMLFFEKNGYIWELEVDNLDDPVFAEAARMAIDTLTITTDTDK